MSNVVYFDRLVRRRAPPKSGSASTLIGWRGARDILQLFIASFCRLTAEEGGEEVKTVHLNVVFCFFCVFLLATLCESVVHY